jgi:hypothetical protein
MTGQKMRGHAQASILFLERTRVTDVPLSLSHEPVGTMDEWAHVAQGAYAGRRSARYLRPGNQSPREQSSIDVDATLTGILEKDEESKLRTVRGKTHEQDGIASYNQGYPIYPCIAYKTLGKHRGRANTGAYRRSTWDAGRARTRHQIQVHRVERSSRPSTNHNP